jgi:endonuclease YncB( thermonuclease family)
MKLLFLLLFAWSAHAETLVGKVVSVADGDTLTVANGEVRYKVRLSGIDAPEGTQAFGSDARHSLSELTLGRIVSVEWHKRDRYRRLVGKVIVDGSDICLKQIQLGWAWHYREYEREQSAGDRVAYSRAESSARAARLGLWADPEPIPPWNLRMRTKSPAAIAPTIGAQK